MEERSLGTFSKKKKKDHGVFITFLQKSYGQRNVPSPYSKGAPKKMGHIIINAKLRPPLSIQS